MSYNILHDDNGPIYDFNKIKTNTVRSNTINTTNLFSSISSITSLTTAALTSSSIISNDITSNAVNTGTLTSTAINTDSIAITGNIFDAYYVSSRTIQPASLPPGVTLFFATGTSNIYTKFVRIGDTLNISIKGIDYRSIGSENLSEISFDNTTEEFDMIYGFDNFIYSVYTSVDPTFTDGKQINRKLLVEYDGTQVTLKIYKLNTTSAIPDFLDVIDYAPNEQIIVNGIVINATVNLF